MLKMLSRLKLLPIFDCSRISSVVKVIFFIKRTVNIKIFKHMTSFFYFCFFFRRYKIKIKAFLLKFLKIFFFKFSLKFLRKFYIFASKKFPEDKKEQKMLI